MARKTAYNHFTSSSRFLITSSDHSRPLPRWSPTPNTAAALAARKKPAMLCRKLPFPPPQLCRARGSLRRQPIGNYQCCWWRAYCWEVLFISEQRGIRSHTPLCAPCWKLLYYDAIDTLASATEGSLECSGRILITANNWHYCVLFGFVFFFPYRSSKWPFTK